jgi:hypothetical protein
MAAQQSSEGDTGGVPGYFEGHGLTFDDALLDASEKAKGFRQGWYRVVTLDVLVGDSLHDYKAILGPDGPET